MDAEEGNENVDVEADDDRDDRADACEDREVEADADVRGDGDDSSNECTADLTRKTSAYALAKFPQSTYPTVASRGIMHSMTEAPATSITTRRPSKMV